MSLNTRTSSEEITLSHLSYVGQQFHAKSCVVGFKPIENVKKNTIHLSTKMILESIFNELKKKKLILICCGNRQHKINKKIVQMRKIKIIFI